MKKNKIILALLFMCQLSFSQVKSEEPLISFNLFQYKPGDNRSSSSTHDEIIRIDTGNLENNYKDTLVQRHKEIDIHLNILGLYKKSFIKIPKNRIIYADNISYINSYKPENLYNVSFSYSSLMGDYRQYYIDQLNTAFGLTTHTVQKKTEVLVLKNIITNDSTVKRVKNQIGAYNIGYSVEVGTEVKIKSGYINTSKLVESIESVVNTPVFDGMSESMFFSIYIENNLESRKLDSWIEMFKKYGIILEKETRDVDFIEIIEK